MKNPRLYTLFWNKRGVMKYNRVYNLAYTKQSAVRMFQSILLAPFTKPGWPSHIQVSLRPCKVDTTVVGWPDEVTAILQSAQSEKGE